MNMLKINDQYSFMIERYDKRLRLIVMDGVDEWVCRKVNPTELSAFLSNNDAHLFKGRLQLDKVGNDIIVNVKGNELGLISSQAFLHSTNQVLAVA